MFELIKEQLENYCDCLPEMDDNKFDKNLAEMINLISIMTCWTQEPCETFLNSERKEVIDVEKFDPCSCDGGIIEFTPYYTPFVPDSFQVTLVTQKGVSEEAVILDSADYAYSTTFEVLRIDIRDQFKNIACGCPENSKLVITYDAGYELLPDCLLPIFCDLFHVIADKNVCDCSACTSCKGEDVVVEFNDDVAKNLDDYLNTLVQSGYKKQLGLMSLCGRKTVCFWGTVV